MLRYPEEEESETMNWLALFGPILKQIAPVLIKAILDAINKQTGGAGGVLALSADDIETEVHKAIDDAIAKSK